MNKILISGVIFTLLFSACGPVQATFAPQPTLEPTIQTLILVPTPTFVPVTAEVEIGRAILLKPIMGKPGELVEAVIELETSSLVSKVEFFHTSWAGGVTLPLTFKYVSDNPPDTQKINVQIDWDAKPKTYTFIQSIRLRHANGYQDLDFRITVEVVPPS